MIPWRRLGEGRADGSGTLVLAERDGEYSIRVGGQELMSSRAHGSEEAMAQLTLAAAAPRDGMRILVAGLGMGFTLRATLDAARPDAAVVVAELVPAVVEWNRGPLAELAARPLADPRVTVETVEVGRLLRSTRTRFDAILFDIDNGPAALTRPANQVLYGVQGLGLVRGALRTGGAFSVWSAAASPEFERTLARAGFSDVAAHRAAARGAAGGPAHTIFLALAR